MCFNYFPSKQDLNEENGDSLTMKYKCGFCSVSGAFLYINLYIIHIQYTYMYVHIVYEADVFHETKDDLTDTHYLFQCKNAGI